MRTSAWATASAPSAASPTTSMSGWRSSSSRRPPRTTPWSSAISTFIAASLRGGARRPSRALARECTSTRPPASRARSRMPVSPWPPVALDDEATGAPMAFAKPRPSSVMRTTGRALVAADLDRDARRCGVALDVAERLLHDAVDHGLLVVVEVGELTTAEVERHVDPRRLLKAVGLGAQRGLEAVVVQRGGAQLARQAQQLVHRAGRQALGLAQLLAQRRAARPGPWPRVAAARRSAPGWPRRAGRAPGGRARPPGRAARRRPCGSARPRGGRASG